MSEPFETQQPGEQAGQTYCQRAYELPATNPKSLACMGDQLGGVSFSFRFDRSGKNMLA
jgi:hypothetical protein